MVAGTAARDKGAFKIITCALLVKDESWFSDCVLFRLAGGKGSSPLFFVVWGVKRRERREAREETDKKKKKKVVGSRVCCRCKPSLR